MVNWLSCYQCVGIGWLVPFPNVISFQSHGRASKQTGIKDPLPVNYRWNLTWIDYLILQTVFCALTSWGEVRSNWFQRLLSLNVVWQILIHLFVKCSCVLAVFRYKALPQVYSDYLCGDPPGVPVPASHEADCCCGQIPILCSGNFTHIARQNLLSCLLNQSMLLQNTESHNSLQLSWRFSQILSEK